MGGMMLTEERKIYFPKPKLLEALAGFCETTKLNFPFNDKAKLSFRTKPELAVTLSDPIDPDTTREFLESEIAAALILLCRKMNIPIARKARKSIELSDDKIVFVMKLADAGAQD